MISKNGALSFDVNAQSKRPINAAIQFSTQDINTARLSFKITKDGAPLPLSAVVGKLAMTMGDGSRFIKDVTLVDKTEGLAEYVLTAEEIRHYGVVKAELLLRYTNGQALSIHKFGFEIDRSLIDQEIAPIAEYYIDDFEALRGRVDELYDSVVDTVRELEAKFADLENVETKTGAQAKVDVHANKSDIHVTAQKKKEWDAKETTTGAQEKVDTHANDAALHVTKDERSAWNGSQLYRLTQDSGTRKLIPDGADLLTLPPGFYFGINNRLLNNPDPSDIGWFNYDISESNSDRKMIIAVASYKNTMWFSTVHGGLFRGWKRVLTDDELNSTWNQVTFVTGTTKHFAGNPLKFSIRQNTLHLRGSFEGIPANDAVIARFTQKPSGITVFGGQTIGAYGSARFTLGVDGSLKFDGMDSADNSKVTRIEINEYIPLW
ncbi:phage baseplate upper protein [Bacillus altitudinis]|uniref:phage baseplate upper protein n=1 Tax=Bacillus altitudinis TaxID=293387 RepID=UPI00227E70EA|nr:phage baseplate upper protein [Bacillus altitudinis]MCY7629109.1 phage baseplate upper protein [Bacillus altitudinis]